MNQTDSNKRFRRTLSIISAALTTTIIVGFAIYYGIPILQDTLNVRYAIEHLDPHAVPPSLNPYGYEYEKTAIDYVDSDQDGDFETILKRMNTSGEYAEIQLELLDGEIIYPNLAENAVPPGLIPNVQETGLFEHKFLVDYLDIDNDGKLESIAYIGYNELQPVKIELIDNQYVFTNF